MALLCSNFKEFFANIQGFSKRKQKNQHYQSDFHHILLKCFRIQYQYLILKTRDSKVKSLILLFFAVTGRAQTKNNKSTKFFRNTKYRKIINII